MGFTPLCWAARNNHYEVVVYLQELGANLEKNRYSSVVYSQYQSHEKKILLTVMISP